MSNLASVTIEASDADAARDFYAAAFGTGLPLDFRVSEQPTSGFRGFHISLTMAQPSDVDAVFAAALAASAREVQPVKKSLWGYGGVLEAPDGSIWKVVSSSKKDKGPTSRDFESLVLLIGADDVAASKDFYVGRGFEVEKSFGKKYVEFKQGDGAFVLGLLSRKALAKDASVPMEGSGSHRVVLHGGDAAAVDPDGFVWEPATS